MDACGGGVGRCQPGLTARDGGKPHAFVRLAGEAEDRSLASAVPHRQESLVSAGVKVRILLASGVFLGLGVVLAVVGVSAVLAEVVLIQQVLWQLPVSPR